MKKLFIFFILLPVFLNARETSIEGIKIDVPEERIISQKENYRIVELTARAKYTNNSNKDIQRTAHYFTMPPDNIKYQKILKMTVSTGGDYQIKPAKNNVDRYIKIYFSIKSRKTREIWVKYILLTIPLNYNKVLEEKTNTFSYPDHVKKYLQPSKYIESDSTIISQIAKKIFNSSKDPVSTAKRAYEYPSKTMKFKRQKKARGAAYAAINKTGDCTEYASLFCALCRASGIPARSYAVFNFRNKRSASFRQPNHSIAEVYFSSIGWIPVDPNLGFGKYTNKSSFGKTSNSVIYLKRDTWTYSRARVRGNYRKNLPVKVTWSTKILKESSTADLIKQRTKQK